MARCDKEGIYEFTRLDRTGYKMIIVQLLENLNYMCAVFQHKKIKMENQKRPDGLLPLASPIIRIPTKTKYVTPMYTCPLVVFRSRHKLVVEFKREKMMTNIYFELPLMLHAK